MKKLEEYTKKNIYQVPEGYFDKLPGIIQSRVAADAKGLWWTSLSWSSVRVASLRYALPLIILGSIGIFWFKPFSPKPVNFEMALSQFQPEQLAEYLNAHDVTDDSDLSTEELAESVQWTAKDINKLTDTVYSNYGASHRELEKALDEIDNEL